MKIEYTCPLGSECEKAEDGVLKRCLWYVQLMGEDPQTRKPINESRCAIAWQPILMIDGNGATNGVAASVQSLRNETILRQDKALGVLNNEKQHKIFRRYNNINSVN